MGVFEHFPYTNFHDLNLDWIIQELQKLTVSVQDFVSINAIKYADPIQWDITSQYEKNTVVLDVDGNAYLSVQPVPAGVSLDRTEFWTNIGNFSALWENVKSAIAVPDEGHNTTASAARQPNTLVWVDGKLLEVTSSMKAGDRYNTNVGGNSRLYTMQMLLDALLTETHNRENAVTMLESGLESEIADRKAADTAIREDIRNSESATTLYNALKNGFIGDGETDNNGAFSAFKTSHPDKTVLYFPAGMYYFSNPISIPDDYTIFGDGENTVFIFLNDGFTIPGFRVAIHDISVKTRNGGTGLVIASSYGSYNNIAFNDAIGFFNPAIKVGIDKITWFNIINNIHINTSGADYKGGAGIAIASCSNNLLSNIIISKKDAAFRFEKAENGVIDGCQIVNANVTTCNYGIYGRDASAVFISNSIFDQISKDAVNAVRCKSFYFDNCYISNGWNGDDTSKIINMNSCNAVSFINSSLHGNPSNFGATFSKCTDIVVRNCTVTHATTAISVTNDCNNVRIDNVFFGELVTTSVSAQGTATYFSNLTGNAKTHVYSGLSEIGFMMPTYTRVKAGTGNSVTVPLNIPSYIATPTAIVFTPLSINIPMWFEYTYPNENPSVIIRKVDGSNFNNENFNLGYAFPVIAK